MISNIERLNLQTNITKRMDCPFCYNTNTFSVTKKVDGIFWYCFHDSCNAKGYKGKSLSKEEAKEILIDRESNTPVFNIPEKWHVNHSNVEKILQKYKICKPYLEKRLAIEYDIEKERYVFLIYIDGQCIGGVGRSYTQKPKWLIYKSYPKAAKFPLIVPKHGTYLKPEYKEDEPKIGVIVEDAISAASISLYHDGIGILGTHITSSYLTILIKYDKLYIALDADATKTALKHHKYINQFVPTELIILKQDIKDMKDEEVSILFT
jgi:hypothetical protein